MTSGSRLSIQNGFGASSRSSSWLGSSMLFNRLINRNGHDNGHLLQFMDDHSDGVNCLALSEDLSLLVSGGEDCIVRLWSTFSTPCECIGLLRGHTDYITCCAVHRYLVISGSADCTLKVWRIEDGYCLVNLTGHEAFVSRCATFGPLLISASFDNTVRVWSLTDKLTIVQNGDDQNNLVTRNQLDTTFGQCLYVLQDHEKSVTQATIINNDPEVLNTGVIHELDLVLTTSTDGRALIYKLANGELRHELIGHNGPINCLAVDGKESRFVYTAGADSLIKNWDVITGEFIRDLKGHQASILCLLAHNRILYSGSVDRTVRAWAMEFGQCTRVYYQNTAPVSCLQYFKGILYTGCNDYCARLYDSNSAVLKQTFTGHSSSISALQVVPGKLFTSSFDGKIMVWDCSHLQRETINIQPEPDKPEQVQPEQRKDLILASGCNQSLNEDMTFWNELTNIYQSAVNMDQDDESIGQKRINQSSDGCIAFVSYYCCWPWITSHIMKSIHHIGSVKDHDVNVVNTIQNHDHRNDNIQFAINQTNHYDQTSSDNMDDSLNVQRALQALEPYLRSFGT